MSITRKPDSYFARLRRPRGIARMRLESWKRRLDLERETEAARIHEAIERQALIREQILGARTSEF